jgi:hypothetical protein
MLSQRSGIAVVEKFNSAAKNGIPDSGMVRLHIRRFLGTSEIYHVAP